MKKTQRVVCVMILTAGIALTSAIGAFAEKRSGIDYLVLVNKLHPLPEGWEDALETVHMTNSVGDDVEVETKA